MAFGLSNSGKYKTSVPNLDQVLLSSCDPPEIHFLADFSLYSVKPHQDFRLFEKECLSQDWRHLLFLFAPTDLGIPLCGGPAKFLILKLLTLLAEVILSQMLLVEFLIGECGQC